MHKPIDIRKNRIDMVKVIALCIKSCRLLVMDSVTLKWCLHLIFHTCMFLKYSLTFRHKEFLEHLIVKIIL